MLASGFPQRICMLMMMLYFPLVDACLTRAHVGTWTQLCSQLPQLCLQVPQLCLQPNFGSLHSAPGPSLKCHQTFAINAVHIPSEHMFLQCSECMKYARHASSGMVKPVTRLDCQNGLSKSCPVSMCLHSRSRSRNPSKIKNKTDQGIVRSNL